tara:strand:- start:129 stop:416 length:288 start_codon:yes stop_codon:yes gene_type:complete
MFGKNTSSGDFFGSNVPLFFLQMARFCFHELEAIYHSKKHRKNINPVSGVKKRFEAVHDHPEDKRHQREGFPDIANAFSVLRIHPDYRVENDKVD